MSEGQHMPKTVINLEERRSKKEESQALNRIYEEMTTLDKHDAVAEQRFFTAWKAGVNYLGKEYFKVQNTVKETTTKWQLEPNLEFINKVFGSKSHGQQVLIALMYSFFDSIEGQKLLERAQAPNIVDALVVLDRQGKEIFGQLSQYYSGW